MTTRARPDSSIAATWTTYVEQAMEVLWLLAALMVPLIFFGREYVLSEAVNAYVEVPKTTTLRILVGMMAILWVFEWALRGGLTRTYNLANYPTTIREWLWAQPGRLIVVAATFYVVVAIITTLLSQNFFISLWGEVSGQFGYSLYTIASYFVLFAVMATHLKTPAQLFRLLAVVVITGSLVALYAILQHYGLDPVNTGEAGPSRVASTMANPVFSGAALVATITLTFGVGLAVLDRLGWSPYNVLVWVALVAVQLMAIFWTGSRGSWLIGAPLGLVAFVSLPPLIETTRGWFRGAFGGETQERNGSVPLDLMVLLASVVLLDILVVASILGVLDLLGIPGTPMLRVSLATVGVMAFLSEFVVLAPAAFSPPVRSFAKGFLLLASALLVTILVITLTPAASPATPEMDLKDLPGLPNSQRVLIVLGVLAVVPLTTLAMFTFRDRLIEKATLVIASGFFIVVLVATLTSESEPSPVVAQDSTALAVAEATPEAAQPAGRGLSYRTDIWSASMGLVVNRPWFGNEDLTLSFVRPIIGYGPELFKYTFPLESPLGGLLSHAHNFWIHHFVEQGALGFLTSVGLFVAFFAVGLAQLWRNWATYSTIHRWILLTLVAAIVGRTAEMMVGTARESDLVTFWIMLAMLVALPSVMAQFQEAPSSGTPGAPIPPQRRRDRRAGMPSRKEKRAAGRAGRGGGAPISPILATGIVLVSALVIGIGWLTWDKNVDYLWASRIAAQARDQFAIGQFQEAHKLMSKAVAKAPDIPIYQNNLAAMYDAYGRSAAANPDAGFPSCAEFFSLDTRPDGPVLRDPPFADCAEEAYISNLRGFLKNTTAPQVKRPLATATLQLGLNGYVGKDEEAIRYHRELTQMVPDSLLDYNNLINAYFRLGQAHRQRNEIELADAAFNAALASSEDFLTVSRNVVQTSHGLYIRGVAYRQLDQLDEAVDSFEQSINVDEKGPSAAEAHRQLSEIYATLGDEAQAEEHSQLYQELTQG